MALEFLAVTADATVGDAIKTVREKGKDIENLYHIWVTDDFQKLMGVITLKDLVLEPEDRKISDIMNPDVISVETNTDQEEVANLVKRYDLVNIPVVDDHFRLVGRITRSNGNPFEKRANGLPAPIWARETGCFGAKGFRNGTAWGRKFVGSSWISS